MNKLNKTLNRGSQLKDNRPVEIVSTKSRFAAIIDSALTQPRVAIDLESNGFYHYPERISLIQIATSDQISLVDTLSLDDFGPLKVLMAEKSVEKILHSADYDIRSLDRDFGIRVQNMFDTSIAAWFLGAEKRGLAAVLNEHMGVIVNKDKKLQRADWSQRPLPCDLLRYAAEDVRHLDKLRNILCEKLELLGRSSWVQEECERLTLVQYKRPDTDWGFLTVKGSRTLGAQQLAVLRSLHHFRENEALRRDTPPFKILSDSVILALCNSKSSDVSQIKGLGRYAYRPGSSAIKKAIREGLESEPVKRPITTPDPRKRFSQREHEEIKENLSLLKGWRNTLSNCLRLDGGLLWPAASMERLSKNPEGLEVELKCNEVRKWQYAQFADSLRPYLHRLKKFRGTS